MEQIPDKKESGPQNARGTADELSYAEFLKLSELIREIIEAEPPVCEPKMGKATLEALWEEFGNTPIDDADRIVTPFCGWEEGTDRFEIWRWFDSQYAEWGGVAALGGFAR